MDVISQFLERASTESFIPVFRALYVPLLRYFLVRGVDVATAEELVQDVLLTVYRRAAEVRNIDCFHGWLFQVARNCFLQYKRKRQIVTESLRLSELKGRGYHPSDVPLIQEESELFDWIEELDTDEREICLMRYVDDLDYTSISKALEIPLGTVKWKLYQIKKKVGAKLSVTKAGLKR